MEKYCTSCRRVFKDSDYKLCPYCGSTLKSRVGRKPIPKKVRHAVFQKDNYHCRECGRGKEHGITLEIDHIIPVAEGGTNDISNLQTLCEDCNRGKGTNTWVGGEINPDSNGNIFNIKTREEKHNLMAERHRREVEAKRKKLFDNLYPKVTSNQIDKLRFGNYTLENSNKTEIISYLVKNFSEDEINFILKSIDDLEQQNQELKNKHGISSFCIIKCHDICYYYYKFSHKRYGRFYAWSEEELKEKVLVNDYPWIFIEGKWYNSHADNFINKIYSHESIGTIENINKFSSHITSDDLMKKVMDNLDPIKPKGFSAHGYKFCDCGNKIKYYDRYCSQCKPPQNLFDPIKKPKLIIRNIACPNCGKMIKENAIRCKYCKTMLKSYSNVDSSDNLSSTIDKVNQGNKKTIVDNKPSDAQLLDDDIKKKIEENMDDVCRIFSIPNLGKKFVINKLTNDFTKDEISNKINKYLNNSQKESSISKRIAHKRKLMENNIKPIPEEHFKLYFIIHNSSFKSKNKFINHMQTYWGINEINRFYDEYASLLKNGIQKEHFEKIMEYDIKDTCEIFSMHYSMRRLGNRFVINRILNNHTENEIKEKLNSHFNLSIEYLNKIDTTNYESEEEKVSISSKPDYYTYKIQVNSLKSKFIKKEQNVRELVEKCFPAPQMTNTKFITMIDECSKIFNQNVESTILIIESTNKYSDKLENQLKSEIEILKELNIKLDLLRDELLIVHSENDNPNADMLFNEMDGLIESVKNYKNI